MRSGDVGRRIASSPGALLRQEVAVGILFAGRGWKGGPWPAARWLCSPGLSGLISPGSIKFIWGHRGRQVPRGTDAAVGGKFGQRAPER